MMQTVVKRQNGEAKLKESTNESARRVLEYIERHKKQGKQLNMRSLPKEQRV